MTARALTLAILLSGCLNARSYVCDRHDDCTGGAAGRCEAEGVCSFLDPTCESGRRIGDYGGNLSNTCTQARPLSNACVAGEPWPTIDGDACAHAVCERIPACCSVMWSEACVHVADQVCEDVHCGKWIAATGPAGSHLLEWTGSDYTAHGELPGATGVVAWIDGHERRPRLVIGRGRLVASWALAGPESMPSYAPQWSFDSTAGSVVQAITAVDVDGDDAIEVGLAFGGAAPSVVLVDQTGTLKTTVPGVGAADALSWADFTDDGVPDFVVGTPGDYRVFYWSAVHAAYELRFPNPLAGSFASVGWDDVDGDTRLDLVTVGTFVALHLNDDPMNFRASPTESDRPPGGNLPSVGAIGDLDGDHHAEVIAANTQAPAKLGVYRWSASAGAFENHLFDTAPLSQIALADVDDDGMLDVIGAVAETGGLVWFKNTSTSTTISFLPATPIAAAGNATSFAVTGWRAP